MLDDLATTVEDTAQRSALMSGSLPDPSVPVHEIAHPIIAAATARYSGDTPPDRSELLRDVRDQKWAKCRHGERWRGIVLWNPEERRWLCFAGWHEKGDADDVYTDFAVRSAAAQGTDSSAFLPSQEDVHRLQAEELVQRLAETKRRFKVLVINALLQAISARDVAHTVVLPGGSELQITLVSGEDDPADDDWIFDLILQVSVNWDGGASAKDVVSVQDAVPGIAEGEWIPDSGVHAGGDPRFYVMVDESWVERILRAVEEHGAEALGSDRNLALDRHDGQAHYSTQGAVDRGYYDGTLLRSLCGRRFIPMRDPAKSPVCEDCANTKAAYDLVREQLRGDG